MKTPTYQELNERAYAGTWIDNYNLDTIYTVMKSLPSTDLLGCRSVVEVWHQDGYTIGWAFVQQDTVEWAFVFATNEEQADAE